MAAIEIRGFAFNIAHVAIVGPIAQDSNNQKYTFPVVCIGCDPIQLVFADRLNAENARDKLLDRVENG